MGMSAFREATKPPQYGLNDPVFYLHMDSLDGSGEDLVCDHPVGRDHGCGHFTMYMSYIRTSMLGRRISIQLDCLSPQISIARCRQCPRDHRDFGQH